MATIKKSIVDLSDGGSKALANISWTHKLIQAARYYLGSNPHEATHFKPLSGFYQLWATGATLYVPRLDRGLMNSRCVFFLKKCCMVLWSDFANLNTYMKTIYIAFDIINFDFGIYSLWLFTWTRVCRAIVTKKFFWPNGLQAYMISM